MVELGDEFKINGKIGVVSFKGNYYDQDYICVVFEEDRTFGIYKYKIENGKYLFAPEEDKEKYSYILADLVTDEVIGQAENKSDNE